MMKQFILTFLSFALLIIQFTGCNNQPGNNENMVNATDSLKVPDSEVIVATIYLYEEEQIKAEVKADKILKFEVIDSTMAYVLDIDIFDSLGNVSTHIVGDSGIIREEKSQMQIYGNVRVLTEDSTVLETEYLRWDSQTDRIRTEAYVRIVKDNDVISGYGLDADNKLTSIKILNSVSGEIKDPEKLKEQ